MKDIMENIKELRNLTGAGFLDCKKALEENNHNIENSIDFLRKKGLAKASKKSSRQANEGGIGIYINENKAVMIEINTETDFAAKNEVFLNFMDKIGNFALSLNANDLSIENFNESVLDETKISQHFSEIISKIGENIVLNKLFIMNNSSNSMISSYIHNSYSKNIGKIAVILKSEVEKISDEAIALGKNICMHIAASKPLAMDVGDLDSDLINKEKEIQIDSIKSSGKPDNIVEKILEGKMKKFYSESTLLNQPYIFDTDKTLDEIITEFSINNNLKLIDYKLSVIGK